MEEAFKNLRWTRVTSLLDFDVGKTSAFDMAPDIQEAINKMEEIDLNSKPSLNVLFDPIKWPTNNPMQHPTVYKLSQEQL